MDNSRLPIQTHRVSLTRMKGGEGALWIDQREPVIPAVCRVFWGKRFKYLHLSDPYFLYSSPELCSSLYHVQSIKFMNFLLHCTYKTYFPTTLRLPNISSKQTMNIIFDSITTFDFSKCLSNCSIEKNRKKEFVSNLNTFLFLFSASIHF